MPDTAPSPSSPLPNDDADTTGATGSRPVPGVPDDLLAGLRARAESGDARAQVELADRLHFGDGVPQDDAAAFLWMRRAADQGLPEAQAKTGWFLLYGSGVPRDPAAAVGWLRRGASGGYSRAAHNLGLCYSQGDGVPQRPRRARVWLKRAIELGHVDSRSELARLLIDGLGGPADVPAAIGHLRAGARAGSLSCMRDLAHAEVRGLTGPDDRELAERLLVEAHENGSPEALDTLFLVWRIRSPLPPLPARGVEAVDELSRLAEENAGPGEPSFEDLAAVPVPELRRMALGGSRRAASELGFRYFRADGLPWSCPRGARWLRRAAEKGEPAACAFLGEVLCEGDAPGVPGDFAEGLRLLRLASAAGSDRARVCLARRLLAPGEHEDPAEAAWWLRFAALGDAEAAERLSRHYFAGVGVPEDEEAGFGWLALAGDEASPAGRYQLGTALVFGGVTPRDPARAFRLVKGAAEGGHVRAMKLLAAMHDDGIGVERDGLEAVRWFRAAAEEGDAEAAFDLASVLFDGRGVPPDPAAAVSWLEKAGGCSHAPHLLSLMLFRGEGNPRDVPRARAVFLDAVGKRHLPSLFTTLEEEAVRYRPAATRSRDQREAVLEAAAAGEAGDARAALDAALVLWNADCGMTEDRPRALELFRVAAEAGDPLAQACLYEAQRVTSGGDEVDWLVRAADAGLAGAQRELARELLSGPSGPDATEEATRRLEAAVEAGDALACAELARLLTDSGQGDTDRVRDLLRYAREAGVTETEV